MGQVIIRDKLHIFFDFFIASVLVQQSPRRERHGKLIAANPPPIINARPPHLMVHVIRQAIHIRPHRIPKAPDGIDDKIIPFTWFGAIPADDIAGIVRFDRMKDQKAVGGFIEIGSLGEKKEGEEEEN